MYTDHFQIAIGASSGGRSIRMIKAIVYMSEAGHTKGYAELLGERTDLPVYDLNTAIRKVPKEAEIIYLG